MDSVRGNGAAQSTVIVGAELITAVRVDQPEVRKAHFQVMQQRRLVEVAESCQVIYAHQHVRVPQRGKTVGLGGYFVLHHLRRQEKGQNS